MKYRTAVHWLVLVWMKTCIVSCTDSTDSRNLTTNRKCCPNTEIAFHWPNHSVDNSLQCYTLVNNHTTTNQESLDETEDHSESVNSSLDVLTILPYHDQTTSVNCPTRVRLLEGDYIVLFSTGNPSSITLSAGEPIKISQYICTDQFLYNVSSPVTRTATLICLSSSESKRSRNLYSPGNIRSSLYTVHSILLSISAFFLLLTLIISCVLPSSRNRLSSWSLQCYVFSLMFALVFYAVIQMNHSDFNDIGCIVVGTSLCTAIYEFVRFIQ
jgi:hypothetical protein